MKIKALFLMLLLSAAGLRTAGGQVNRMSAGLSFASGLQFNAGSTGNPGFGVKTWIGLDKRGALQLVPSLTAFNRFHFENGIYSLTNYMFMADLNLQYAIFEEGTVRAVVFGGGNFTYLTSDFEKIFEYLNPTIEDATDYAPGGNLGAGLELRMSSHWDFNVSGRYILSSYNQFVIGVDAVYYFYSRRRSFRR